MNSRLKLAGGAALLVLAMASANGVYAQETTGALRGQVTDASGAGVAGATVVVTYAPTNQSITTMTGDAGFFSVRGLRVGGPYTIKTTLPSGESNSQTVASVSLGDPTPVEISFAAAVAEVVVTASAAGSAQSQGVGTNFTSNDIANLPSVSRDLKDVVRLDPFATIDPTNQDALSFAGANTRFNQVTVDGIRQNDDFGLNNNGYPTQRSPISTEAVAGMQVSIAPYSTVNNGFTGGSVNAVTKSGSNEFHGALYGDKTSNDLRGDEYVYYDTRANSPTRGSRVAQKVTAPFDEKTWGANLGGPIVRDNLYFFLSYEKYEGNFGLDEGPADSGRGTVVPRITQAAIDTFQAATKAKYGVDPGSWVKSTPPITDEKALVKLDWDITADHRASLTWQDTKSASFNGSVSDLFAGGDSTTQPRIGLNSYQYVKDEHLTNYTVQLNSRWTSNLSTELRLGKKETETVRTTFAPAGIGEITVNVADLAGVGPGSGTPQIRFGNELNSQPNYLSTKTDTAEFRVRYSLQDNEFLVGGRIEKQDILNIFGRNYLPSYTFASFADFVAGRAATTTLTTAVEPNGGTVAALAGRAARNAAAGEFYVNSIYAEDTLQATDTITVLAGVRYDWYSQDSRPDYNAAFFSRHGITNTANLDGKHIVLPRIYAKWTPTNDLDFAVGLGRFSTQGLGVWLLNPIGNSGVVQVNAVCPAGPYTLTNLAAVVPGCTATPGNGNTNSLAPGLKIPSAWKTTFSAGYNFDASRFRLGADWRVQADLLHQVNQDSLFWYDLRAQRIGVAPDGRPVYGRTTTGTIGANVFDMQLTNLREGGSSDSVAVSLGKFWRDGILDGLNMKTSYTYTEAKDRNPMTSSIADSSYTRFATSDAQNPTEATSDYEIRHKWSMSLAYERAFFGDNKTSINVYAQSRSGLPFSYTFDASSTSRNDAEFGNYVSTYSGRQAKSNQLLYVPKTDGSGNVTATSDPRVTYAAGFDVANFNQFLKNTGLIDYQGRIAPRNGFRTSRVTTVDLNVTQEIPAFFPTGAKLLGFVTLENFGNLLNNKWGRLEQYDFYRGVPVVNITCAGAGGSCLNQSVYTYSGLQTAVGADPASSLKNRDQPIRPFGVANGSLWQVKLGLKYQF
jgi:outer membrane receptor protein involved in Fe transport